MSRATASLIVLGALSLAAPPAAAQSTERSMYVSVLDESSKPVTGLGPEAFTVREDGRPREVLRASPATAPIDLALLVDNSQAATAEINDLRRAIEPFITALASKGHQIAIIGLADRPTVLVDYTSAAERLQKGVGRIFAQETAGMLLLDGLVDASRGLRRRESERRVILSVTTEGTDFSNLGYEQTLEALDDSGAQYYALVITGGPRASLLNEESRNRGIVLDRGTRATGGKLDHLITSMSLGDALQKVAAELEAQYHVVYARPDTTVPPEKVEIDVDRPGLTARGVAVPIRSRSAR
jgi:VWFA-related protein